MIDRWPVLIIMLMLLSCGKDPDIPPCDPNIEICGDHPEPPEDPDDPPNCGTGLAAEDLAGTCRANPATMGSLEIN